MPKPKKPDPVPEWQVHFEDYATELQIIACKVIADHGRVRDRNLIRQAVEKHVADQQAEAKRKDKTFEPLLTNRRQVVERGLAVGVTKILEAWDFVQTSAAWPPDGA